MDGFVGLAHTHKFFLDPYNHRCIKDPTSEYHVILLTTVTAQEYERFESGIKNDYSIFIDKIEFDYFNLNKIEE